MTIDQLGNMHRPAGAPDGGQFTGRQNSAPNRPLVHGDPHDEAVFQERLLRQHLEGLDALQGAVQAERVRAMLQLVTTICQKHDPNITDVVVSSDGTTVDGLQFESNGEVVPGNLQLATEVSDAFHGWSVSDLPVGAHGWHRVEDTYNFRLLLPDVDDEHVGQIRLGGTHQLPARTLNLLSMEVDALTGRVGPTLDHKEIQIRLFESPESYGLDRELVKRAVDAAGSPSKLVERVRDSSAWFDLGMDLDEQYEPDISERGSRTIAAALREVLGDNHG